MPASATSFYLPPIFAINETLDGNLIQQLLLAEDTIDANEEEYDRDGVSGRLLIPSDNAALPVLIVQNGAEPPAGYDRVLSTRRGRRTAPDVPPMLTWARHPTLLKIPPAPIDYPERCRAALASWESAFAYREEKPASRVAGLRTPQVGAVHAVHAHWATTMQPATIVMPTGTGKTETMLSVLVSAGCPRLLVVVPTDALRAQIAEKFLTLGVLKKFGVVADAAQYPIVGLLKRRPKTVEEVERVFSRCNVIVATAHITGQCTAPVQERMAQLCPVLVIDEAHHIAAPTWQAFREKFERSAILQFTATPFRNDGKPIGGKIIFNYPLRKALEQEYFRPIRFAPVIEFDRRKADEAIAARAVAQLRADLQSERDHILMARVASIERAREVFAIYQRHAEFNPVQFHTGLAARERDQARRLILSKEARIIVCVDMLGEGFDLPELKIAAFHDVKKSLPVTLQLAGRFTRDKPRLGDPTFIANIGDTQVRHELQRLYTQDADWNALLIRSSEEIIADQISLREFLDGFRNFPDDIPLQSMRPAMSTVIYKTTDDEWRPENFAVGLPDPDSIERVHHAINYEQNVLIVVVARKVPIDWTQMQAIFDWSWELYFLYRDGEQNLLFIHGSTNSGHYQKLAAAVADGTELITGAPVFRCFAGVNRLTLQNVGLSEQLGRLIRYIMRAGADVEAGLTEAQKRNARKLNIFGNGYEGGGKTSIGCSYKGRIWSRRVTNIEALTRWCRQVGRKVLDERIDPDEVLRGTLTPTAVMVRPRLMPIAVDWPEIIYGEPESAYEFDIGTETPVPLYTAELRLRDPSEEGEIGFELAANGVSAPFALILTDANGGSGYKFANRSGRPIEIRRGARRMPLEDFFEQNPPTIWFADGSSLEGNLYTALKHKYPPYPAERILAWDWGGVNIRKESQGETKATDSIQYRVIQELKKGSYAVIFDDDASGEAADVVAVLDAGNSLIVDLYHCKYSSEAEPGSRVKDLYEVCGQAQKCVHWMGHPSELFLHLLRREKLREDGGTSRFERGDQAELVRILEMSRAVPVSMRVHIVQPGLSKQRVTVDQLELLGVTENYLMETYKLSFFVIASA